MAVAREVKEESGINIDLASIRYKASQPWPFPQSLMIGFQAKAAPSQVAARTDAALNQLKVSCMRCIICNAKACTPRTMLQCKTDALV
jgi:hypothetical protein